MEQSKFYQIKNITEQEYTLVGCDGSVIIRPIRDVDKSASAFTIQDAKDGDVLVASDGSIFIYAGSTDIYAKSYVALTKCSSLNIEGGNWEDKKSVYPATKEQRDTLMKAMADAGYTFDFEKKELKKVVDEEQIKKNLQDNSFRKMFEQNPAWSEEDDYNLQCMIAKVVSDIQKGNVGRNQELIDWLKFLKDRVQPKVEWSEKDETRLINIIIMLKEGASHHFIKDDITKAVDWLKSLRPQNQWKPSEIQLDTLKELSHDVPTKRGIIEELLEQLKQL